MPASVHREHRSGFTIVEMAVVLALAGLIVAIAMPRANAPERQLTAALRASWATLAAARQQAVLLQHDVHVDFDTASRTLRIHHDSDNDGELDTGEYTSEHVVEGVTFGRGPAPEGPTGDGAVSFEVPTGGTLPRLTFHRSGSSSEFGGFYLRTDRATTSAHVDEVRALTVERATGRVQVFHVAGGRWERTY